MPAEAPPQLESRNPRRSLALLAFGLAAGVGLTAVGVVGDGNGTNLPAGSVAVVNGTPIARSAYVRLVAGLDEDKREGVTHDDRRRVLDRLIDEELLIQRALELGLLRSDQRLRGELAQAMITNAIAQVKVGEPTRMEVERFFAENAAAFSGPGRLRVRRVFVAAEPVRSSADAQQRVRIAAARLRAGEAFDSVAAALADRGAAELPDAFLTPHELRGYLGPTAARTASELGDGQVSDPIRSAAGFQVLQLVASEQSAPPVFTEIENAVRAEWTRKEQERALRGYLDGLRAASSVTVAPVP